MAKIIVAGHAFSHLILSNKSNSFFMVKFVKHKVYPLKNAFHNFVSRSLTRRGSVLFPLYLFAILC